KPCSHKGGRGDVSLNPIATGHPFTADLSPVQKSISTSATDDLSRRPLKAVISAHSSLHPEDKKQ
ncbi:hypothetical protein, partial [Pseudomonas corrugata]|uniref:hypothetical protein n=1 Tax=Pseudomonas corrugata TaxID=47879 RepID=UPI0019D6FCA3